jgi:hypothetical protein
MSIPAYTRVRALGVQLQEAMNEDDFRSLCLYSGELGAIVQALSADAKTDLNKAKMLPCVVPDRGVSDQTMDAAFAALSRVIERERQSGKSEAKKAPWWKPW